jgi:hypothetical protein
MNTRTLIGGNHIFELRTGILVVIVGCARGDLPIRIQLEWSGVFLESVIFNNFVKYVLESEAL